MRCKKCAKDQTIAYAKVGSVLPGDFRLEKIKLRGVESNGMICSAKELGLWDEHEGILLLEDTLTPGTDFSSTYDSKDTSWEIGITPNSCLLYTSPSPRD